MKTADTYVLAVGLILVVLLAGGVIDLGYALRGKQTITDWLRDNPLWFWIPAVLMGGVPRGAGPASVPRQMILVKHTSVRQPRAAGGHGTFLEPVEAAASRPRPRAAYRQRPWKPPRYQTTPRCAWA